MPELTDEEVGQLLRETFTGKENLIDELPEATIRPVRRKAPVLLAAAAVLVVLAGIAVAVDLRGGPQSPPVAGEDPASSTSAVRTIAGESGLVLNARLAGVAVAELAKWERPTGGWPVVKVLQAPYPTAASPLDQGSPGIPFTKPERAAIAASAGLPLQWVKSRPTDSSICDQDTAGTPYFTLGPVVMDKSGASATIGLSVWRGCLDGQWLTYRLERNASAGSTAGSGWHVAGTVGPVTVS